MNARTRYALQATVPGHRGHPMASASTNMQGSSIRIEQLSNRPDVRAIEAAQREIRQECIVSRNLTQFPLLILKLA